MASKKLYDAIARETKDVIHTAESADEIRGAVRVAQRVATAFAVDNERFTHDRFLAACGINPDGTVM